MISSQPDPIDLIERTLRSVIDEVLTDKFGPNWTQDEDAGLGAAWAQKLTEKAKEDQALRAPSMVYDVPLAYAEFRDLGELLTKHQRTFSPVFRDWQITIAHFHAAEKLRNTIQHNRDISPAQQSLLVGIAGEIQDSVNIWRIGTPLQIKRTVLHFQERIEVPGKSDIQIREVATANVAQWRERILSAVQANSINTDWARKLVDGELEYTIQVQHIEASIWTQPTWMPMNEGGRTSYINFQAEFKYGRALKNPDQFLEFIGKPYYVIMYELEDQLNVEALKRWSAERAGLEPSGSQSSNGELESIDYSLFRGRLRISAQKFAERTSGSGGKLTAIAEPPDAFWFAHRLIRPEHLIGFIVGDIAPKAMMHLVQMSRRSTNS